MFLYELFQNIIFFIVKIVSTYIDSPKLQSFINERINFHQNILAASNNLQQQQNKQSSKINCIWIHVASAGELEQAIPILNTLVSKGNIKLFLTYFSPSTIPFINKIPELIGHTAFPLDQAKNHLYIINTLKITDIILVRYDLWPQLINTATLLKVDLHLLAASSISARPGINGKISLLFKRKMLKNFKNIFLISEEDTAFFKKRCRLANIIVTGDPKWNRAKERAKNINFNKNESIEYLSALCSNKKNDKKIIVFGSPHNAEHEIAIKLASTNKNAFYIYVPHETDKRHIEIIKKDFENTNIKSHLLSYLLQNKTTFDQTSTELIIVDQIGFLAEIYALADLAVVGGGFDGNIHNTLEPLAHGTPTLFGNNVRKAKEAQYALKYNAALGFDNPSEMLYFISSWVGGSFNSSNAKQLQEIQKNSKKIFANIPNTSELVFDYILKNKAI